MAPTPDGWGVRASRQQPPVSCRFCRIRKLRCNREQPCSNCISRGLSCQSPGTPRRGASAAVPEQIPATSGELSEPQPQPRIGVEPGIMQRLESLERNLIALHNERQQSLKAAEAEHIQTPPVDGSSQPGFCRPAGCSLPSAPLAPGPQMPYQLEEFRAHLGWLDHLTEAREHTEGSGYATGFSFRVVPVHQIQIRNQQSSNSPYNGNEGRSIQIDLPQPSEARRLCEKYVRDVDCFYHVVHIPTLRDIFESVYSLVDKPEQIPLGHAILVLGVLATATFYWAESDFSDDLLPNLDDASIKNAVWMAATGNLIDLCSRLHCKSLEIVQGLVVFSNTIGHIEGPTHRHRCYFNQALTMARELELHTSDLPGGHPSEYTQVQGEVRRRVWWYLVTTDWLMAALTSRHEGTYQVNPRQMIVDQPRNVEDEDITEGSNVAGRPLEQSTTMSYYIQRMRLAEITRSMVDRSPLASMALGPPSYGDVLETDIELDRFINALPPFFRMRGAGRSTIDTNVPPSQAVQKYFINSLVNTQRCKLHLPYLVRGFTDPTYAYSRTTCLRSARLVIQAELELEEEKATFAQTRLKSAGHLYAVFIASTALVTDIQLRGASAQQDPRNQDAHHALRILEAASHQSVTMATQFRSMIQTLKRQGVVPAQTDTVSQRGLPGSLQETSTKYTGLGTTGVVQNDTADIAMGFDTFASSANLEDVDWSTVMTELDASFL